KTMEKRKRKQKEADKSRFKREQRVREIAHNQELAEIGSNQEARKRAIERHKADELKREEEHLMQIMELYSTILSKSEFQNMSLDILTDEQRDAIVENLEAVNLKVSQRRATMTGEDDD